MKLIFIIGYESVAIPTLREVLYVESLEHGFNYLVISEHECLKHVDEMRSANAVFIYASPQNLSAEVERVIRDKVVISIHPGALSNCSISSLMKAREFWITGGRDNLRGLIHVILKELGEDVEVPEVIRFPWHGIYHPEHGIFESVERYLEIYKKSPLVGLIVPRDHIIYGVSEYIDKLIHAIEEEGLGALAVFTRKFQDEQLKIPDLRESIKEFFFIDGKLVINAIINLTPFSLVLGDVETLKGLNVPIVSPIISFYQSLDEWRKADSIDYLSQVYNVILPELEGLIEPIAYVFSELRAGGRKYAALEDHAKLIARRVKKWIELRKKRPEERKIAIILINPPCKGLEASIGMGFGLDVPESVVRLLRKLKEHGYLVENMPKDGRELIRMFLERKAISEFRWTSVEEIVARGGALDFVDYSTYVSWLEELPEDARNKLVKDWGDPKSVLEKRVEKELVGMVYQGKFVIPGLRFGNVVVLSQPKFGCAGSACDGSVCKVLHDPTIAPPHQWLAVYRWITRVFKADVVIHFGTHGYLEFRPGKGVGLSPSCWPEISIDDAPHLYVYAVSNPMEGMIAKRRSYATIIDHLYPPMELPELYEDLEDLIAQYQRARSLGEEARAKKIYEEIIERARRANIKFSDEGAIEDIHRFLSSVRETQIESGLHIFGFLREEKLAEYVATIMSFDTPDFPSIRRVLAEVLGLDYDELKRNPSSINHLGITNSQALSLLHKLAVNVIKRLLELGVDEIGLDVAQKILEEEVARLVEIRRS